MAKNEQTQGAQKPETDKPGAAASNQGEAKNTPSTDKANERPEETKASEPEKAKDSAPRANLTQQQIASLVKRAALAGGDNLDDLEEMLQSATIEQVERVEERIAALRKAAVKPFYVKGPGKLQVNGKALSEGAVVQLTEAEAAEFGALLAPGKPPRKIDRSKRPAGQYRIVGPGSVWHGGKARGPGEVLRLSERDAQGLDVDLELVE